MKLLTKISKPGTALLLHLQYTKETRSLRIVFQHEAITNKVPYKEISLTEYGSPVRILSRGALQPSTGTLFLHGFSEQCEEKLCHQVVWNSYKKAMLRAGLEMAHTDDTLKIYGDSRAALSRGITG